jgi:hypothetical protein
MDKIDLYMLADPVYRLHMDMFELERAIKINTIVTYKTSSGTSTTLTGAIAVALLGALGLVVEILDISLGSGSAVGIYILVAGLILLRVTLGIKARNDLNKVGMKADLLKDPDIHRSQDYLREVIASYGSRIRLLWDVLPELEDKRAKAKSNEEKDNLIKRITRYREVIDQCLKYIEWAVTTSGEEYEKKQRTKEQHDEIMQWARPFCKADTETGSPESRRP